MIDSTNGTINISSFNKNEGDYTGALFIYYDVVFGIASSKNGDILQIAFPYTHFEQNTSLAFCRGIMLFRDHHFQPIIPKAEAFVIVSQSGITKADSMGMNIESIMKGILRSIENGSVKISKNMLPTIRTQLVDCGFNANEFIGYIIDSFSDSYYQFDEHDFLFIMEQWGIPYENSVQALAIIKANSLNAIFFRPSKNNVDYHLFFDQT